MGCMKASLWPKISQTQRKKPILPTQLMFPKTIRAVAVRMTAAVARGLSRIEVERGSSLRTVISLSPAVLNKKRNFQERPKHINWSRDRKFTPLDQPLEKVLEYLLSHGMVKLPKIADPPVIMGKYREQYCKFHRAMGT